jgi:hypothetical protein
MKKFTNSPNPIRGKIFPLCVASVNVYEHYRVSGVWGKLRKGVQI